MSSKASAASKLAMNILADLKVGVTELVEQYKETNIPLNENASVARVCWIVERILHIGLKDIAIFGTTSLWDYLEEIRECLPNAEKLLDRIKTVQKTDIGRSRAFIRIGLNDQMLGQSLEALVWNRELTTKYFSNESILTSEEYASMMFLLLENIKSVQFSIRVDDPLLGHLHYWDLMARSTVPMSPAPKKSNLPPASMVSPSKPSEIRPSQASPLSSTPKSVTDSPSTPKTEISSPLRNLTSSPAASPMTQETQPSTDLAPVPVPGNPFDDEPIDIVRVSSPPPVIVETSPVVTPEKLAEASTTGSAPSSLIESPLKASNLSIVVESTSSPQSSLNEPKGQLELNTSLLRPDSPTPLALTYGNASNVGSSLQPFEETSKSEMPTNQAGELSPRTPEQRRPSIGHSPVQNYVSSETLSTGRRVPVAESSHTSTSGSSPKFANEEMIESSLMRAPFENEFDLAESPSPYYGRVLYTPPGSGRIPLTPPRSSAKDARLDVLNQGMDILGTTPSQSDLPALFTSLMLQPDIPDHHKQLLHTLKKSIVLLPQLGTKQMITLNVSIARDLLNAIEAVLLDAFAQIPSWDAKYAALWAWLSSVSPATPHVTHILSPLAQLSLLSHVSHITRSRAFIDAAINRKCLDTIISSLVRDPRSIFDPRSLLANDTLSNIFFKLIQELKQYHFDLSENPMDPLLAPDIPPITPPEPSSPEKQNDDAEVQTPSNAPESADNEAMAPETPVISESPSTSVSATNADYKPPSFKKRKKVVTIQDAPPTPQPKKAEKNLDSNDEASNGPVVVPASPIPLKMEPLPLSVVPPPTTTNSVVMKTETPLVASNPRLLANSQHATSENVQVSSEDVQLLLGDLLGSSGGSPSLSSSGASEAPVQADTSTTSGSSKWRTVFKAADTSTLSKSPTKEVLSQSPKGSTSVKLPSSSKAQKAPSNLFGEYGTTSSSPKGYDAGVGPNGSDNASSSSISIATSQPDATLSPTKRNRSFSSNAPAWAREIQQFPVGSYKPNTDWLGGGSGGGFSDDDIINDFDTSIPSSPPKTVPTFSTATSSLSKSPPTHFPREPLPYRVLNANIIAEYHPTSKRSHIKKESNSGTKDADEDPKGSVMILKQLEGEEAVEVDSQLYKNCNPADFFILEIVPKREMTAKNSNCSGCGQDLRKETSRWCSYSGNYYCPNCHSNKKSILPARVVQQWNFKPGKVSDYAYTHLLTNWSRPVLDVSGLVEKANERNERSLSLPVRLPIKIPLLPRNKHSPVTVILTLNVLRERLTTAAEFVRSCRTGQRLLGTMQDRLHLLWSSTLWSMQDLVEADSGKLEPLLKKTIALFSRHVHSCDSCSGKGFVCEICTSKEVIYPFDPNTVSCPNCKGLFHESCWKSNPGKCPKCVRVRAIRMKEKLI